MGFTSAMCSALEEATVEAREAYAKNQTVRTAAKASTTAYTGKTAIMREMAADMIRAVKSFADMQAYPSAIYSAAQIPEPAAPTPAKAPGKPNSIAVNLEPSGAVTISWKATNAAASTGAFFNIARKLPGHSAFTNFVSANGTTSSVRRMSFTDSSIPTSAAGQGAQYFITGQRGILHGTPSDAITVQFGVDGAGAVVTGATLKVAA
ncbi:MAG TPA: hypothetical protein PKE29_15250 [Phycisphaerales bacterium]|nr:hypothetical protein [Phycisphaerales bacterium]